LRAACSLDGQFGVCDALNAGLSQRQDRHSYTSAIHIGDAFIDLAPPALQIREVIRRSEIVRAGDSEFR
jgi:hypothetical protein